MPDRSTQQSGNSSCATCGMACVDQEFHPHALCLLVKARGGDTTAARKDMAFIIRAARTQDLWTAGRINTFLEAVKKSG